MPALNRFLNIVAVLLLAFNTLQVANSVSGSVAQRRRGRRRSGVALHDPAVKPDIYYIILDRYANADTLSQIYDFDNEPFLHELEARGFSIARHAWANYFKTALSRLQLAEHELHRSGTAGRGHEPTVRPSARSSRPSVTTWRCPAALKSIGYDYVHLGGWWEPTATNVDADVSLRYQGSTEFLSAVWGTTMLSLIWPPVYRRDRAGRRDHAVPRAGAGHGAVCLRRAGGLRAATGSDLRVRAHPAAPSAVRLQRRRQLPGERLHRQPPFGAGSTTWSSCSSPTSACCRPSTT